MAIIQSGIMTVGGVKVMATEGRGITAEEWAERTADVIISISQDANPIIRQQAEAYKARLIRTLTYYMQQAIKSDRTTIYNAILDAGHPQLAEHIRRL